MGVLRRTPLGPPARSRESIPLARSPLRVTPENTGKGVGDEAPQRQGQQPVRADGGLLARGACRQPRLGGGNDRHRRRRKARGPWRPLRAGGAVLPQHRESAPRGGGLLPRRRPHADVRHRHHTLGGGGAGARPDLPGHPPHGDDGRGPPARRPRDAGRDRGRGGGERVDDPAPAKAGGALSGPMGRISERFARRRAEGQAAFAAFLTAGDPSLERTVAAASELEAAGVDVLELGVPFSDPLADGPVIQRSSERALGRGGTLASVLDAGRRIRERSAIPLLLFSYLNPLLRHGLERLARDARRSGVDGVLVTDLPPEDAREGLPPAPGGGGGARAPPPPPRGDA